MADGNGSTASDEELDIAPREKAAVLRPRTPDEDPTLVRINTLERHYNDLSAALGQLRAYALGLGKQEDAQRTLMERNARAAALDLAVKAVPDEKKGDPDVLVALASGFLAYLKAGDQGA